MSEKLKKIVEEFNRLYGEFENVLGDETALSLPEAHKKIVNDLGDAVADLESFEAEVAKEEEEKEESD